MSELKFFTPSKNNPKENETEYQPPVLPLKKETTEEQDAASKITRRRFLQLGGATLASLALSNLKFIPNTSTDKEDVETSIKNIKETLKKEETQAAVGEVRDTIKNTYIETENIEIIGQTFREQIQSQNHITLDEATRKAIFYNWQEKYAPETINYKEGIVQGLERMRPWIGEIKKIFASHNVPEEYAFLAIAESHFSNKNISRAGAVGVYQITKSTSQLPDFKMTVNDTYDERLDPLKSAELCAKHLRYSYAKLGNNWDLALLDYNGGYTKGFLTSLQEKESQLPKERLASQGTCILQPDETISQIAQRFETSLTLLYRKNAPAEESFKQWIARMEKARPGEILEIPQKRTIVLTDFYLWLEGEINKKITTELSSNAYVVKAGDNLGAIAEKFHMDKGLLKSLNPDVHERLLHVGQALYVPTKYRTSPDILLSTLSSFSENINYPGKFHAILKIIQDNQLDAALENAPKSFSETRLRKKATLKDISHHEGLELDDLLSLNPAIKSATLPLPMGFSLRIPNTRLIAKSDTQKK
jgi:LysM repeat protein